MRLSLCGCVYIFLKLTFRFKFHMNAPLPGCVCATQSRLSPCGVVQILATRSGLPALPSSVPGILALGASYSVPVYLLPSVRLSVRSPLQLSLASVKSLCLQLELFLFFLFSYIFCRCCCYCCCSCAWPGAFCFMLGIIDFYVTSFWFRFSLRIRSPPAFVSFRFSPLILWLPLSGREEQGG